MLQIKIVSKNESHGRILVTYLVILKLHGYDIRIHSNNDCENTF